MIARPFHECQGALHDILPSILCPTLVITGRQDKIVAWENSRILAERISGAILCVLDPAGHLFWFEQAKETQKAVLAFLSAQHGA